MNIRFNMSPFAGGCLLYLTHRDGYICIDGGTGVCSCVLY